MSSTELTTQENTFIEILLDTGDVRQSAIDAGYNGVYGYTLRKRLAKFIVEAAEDHLSMNAIKAAKKVVDTIDAKMPNPVQLQAAQGLLDRVGIIKKDSVQAPTIKANIFILPEKRSIVIEHE